MKTLLLMIFTAFFALPVNSAENTATGGQWKVQAKTELSKATYLFVMHATGGYIKGNTLFLNNAGPSTLYFSDRPERLAGHLDTDMFLSSWNNAKDSFNSNPPNVVISFTKDGKPVDITLEISQPKFTGSDVTFKIIKVLESGETLKTGKKLKFKHPSLFIDGGCWIFGC